MDSLEKELPNPNKIPIKANKATGNINVLPNPWKNSQKVAFFLYCHFLTPPFILYKTKMIAFTFIALIITSPKQRKRGYTLSVSPYII